MATESNTTTDKLIEQMLNAKASEVRASLSDRDDHDWHAFLRKHDAYHLVLSAAAAAAAKVRPHAGVTALNNLGRAMEAAGL